MPINQLIKEGKIDATKAARLNHAFEHALRELGLVDRADDVRDRYRLIIRILVVVCGVAAATKALLIITSWIG